MFIQAFQHSDRKSVNGSKLVAAIFLRNHPGSLQLGHRTQVSFIDLLAASERHTNISGAPSQLRWRMTRFTAAAEKR
jgi:hypothetical protein